MADTPDRTSNPTVGAPRPGRRLLEELDRYLQANWRTLKGNELHGIYADLLRASQELRGSSSGLTGLAHLLIFRLVYHQLGGAFERKRAAGEGTAFVSAAGYRLGEALPVALGLQTKRPDLSLWKENKLLGIVQIRTQLGQGVQDLLEEVKLLEGIRFANPDLRGVLISFERLPEQGQTWWNFTHDKNKRGWLDLLTLEGNEARVSERLQQGLGLDRFS